MELQDLCRACLRSVGSGASLLRALHPATRLTYADLLRRCAALPAPGSEPDVAPHALCAACAGALPGAWSFVSMCRASDERLRAGLHGRDAIKLEPKLEEEAGLLESELAAPSSSDELLENVKKRHGKVGVKKRKKLKGVNNAVKCEPVTCDVCGHTALTECRYKKHIKSEHPDLVHILITYPCEECGKYFKRRSDLRVHIRIHSGERPFACDRCPRRFAQSGTLIEHRRNHTGETPFSCQICLKVFSSRSSWWRHRRVHTREKPFSCEQCGKSFAHSSTLRTHALVHSEVRPHVCRVCGKATKSKYAMNQHMSLHSEKEFVCEHCGRKFAIKSNLQLHMNKMHSKKSGKCAICARDTSDLQRHMLRHSDQPLFHCDVCSRAFRLKSALAFHLGFHNDASKYRCAVDGCEKTFPKLNMLEFHTRKQHSNETPHVCKHCQKGFFRVSDLTRHINTAHPILIGV